MEKKELENLLMRFSHLGVTHSKNGALLIGKAPHIAEFAWLNIMYPCITEAEVCDLEKKLGCAIPEVYRNFLMNVSNGLNVMNCTLALHGCRTSYNRADFESRYPFNIEDVQKYERPKNATQEMFFFASYNYDCSKLYLNTSDNKIYYCDRYDATPLKSWDSLSAMLTSEIERIFGLFDADGRIFSRMAPTIPVVI